MKKKHFKKTFKNIYGYFYGSRTLTIIALVLAALGAALTILGPNKVGDIVNCIGMGVYGQVDINEIARIGLFLVIIYALSAISMFVEGFLMTTVTLRFSKKLRGDLGKKINKVPFKYFGKTTQGNILSRITNDVSTLQQSLSNSLPTLVSAVAQFIGCLIMMLLTEWRLALCTIGVTMLGIIAMGIVVLKSQKYFIARQESLGKLNGYVEEMYSGHDVVRISRAGRKIKKGFTPFNKAEYNANWKSQFFSGVMHPLMGVIGNLGFVVVCVVGSGLAISNIIEFGTIVSFIIYARLFSTPLIQIAQAMTNLQTAGAASTRVFDFLEAEEFPDESEKNLKIENLKGEVEFNDIYFSYPSQPKKMIINGFSAKVSPGQKVAIVGPTGAGKTTIVNLLMRFYDLNKGSIKIDGVDTKELSRQEVHNMFSMVLQDTWLFEGTIRQNLVYNLKDVTDEQIFKALRATNMEHFVKSFPDGLDTVLTENVTISAGQKQLLTIARAMIRNSPMLILDEATSSVDTRTELIIQKAMDKLMEGRTSFVIAHRLSTIKNADKILVLKDGDIIESGTHQELLNKDGFYAKLYLSQFADIE